LRATPEPRTNGRPTQISSVCYVTSIFGVRPVLKWGRVFPWLNRKHQTDEVFSLSHLAMLHSMDQVRWYELVPIKLSFWVFASFSFIQTCHIVQKLFEALAILLSWIPHSITSWTTGDFKFNSRKRWSCSPKRPAAPCKVTRWLVHKLEKMWKEIIMACLRSYLDIRLRILRKITKNLRQGRQRLGQDLHRSLSNIRRSSSTWNNLLGNWKSRFIKYNPQGEIIGVFNWSTRIDKTGNEYTRNKLNMSEMRNKKKRLIQKFWYNLLKRLKHRKLPWEILNQGWPN
jgi:hypothetical protein